MLFRSQFTLNKINIVEKLGGKEKAQEYLTKYFNLAHERLINQDRVKSVINYRKTFYFLCLLFVLKKIMISILKIII